MAWICLSPAECFEQRMFPPSFSVSASVTGGFGQTDRQGPFWA